MRVLCHHEAVSFQRHGLRCVFLLVIFRRVEESPRSAAPDWMISWISTTPFHAPHEPLQRQGNRWHAGHPPFCAPQENTGSYTKPKGRFTRVRHVSSLVTHQLFSPHVKNKNHKKHLIHNPDISHVSPLETYKRLPNITDHSLNEWMSFISVITLDRSFSYSYKHTATTTRDKWFRCLSSLQRFLDFSAQWLQCRVWKTRDWHKSMIKRNYNVSNASICVNQWINMRINQSRYFIHIVFWRPQAWLWRFWKAHSTAHITAEHNKITNVHHTAWIHTHTHNKTQVKTTRRCVKGCKCSLLVIQWDFESLM